MANNKKKKKPRRLSWLPKAVEKVNHPNHYGGKSNPYEAIKVIEAWGLDKDFLLGNTVKYVSRAGKKVDGIDEDAVRKAELEDLKKASWYLQRKINNLQKKQNGRQQ